MHGGERQAAPDDGFEVVLVEGDAAARAAERKRGTDHDGVAERRGDGPGLVDRLRDPGEQDLDADSLHGLLEEESVLAEPHRVNGRAEGLDAVFLENAGLVEGHREVEGRLPADGRQERVRPLLRDDGGDRVAVERLDVRRVGELGVRHDRRGIRVHEDDAIALPAQRPAGLSPGVVELAGLADHDGPGPENEDGLDVGALRHRSREFTGSTPDACGMRGAPEIESREVRTREREGRFLRMRKTLWNAFAAIGVAAAALIAAPTALSSSKKTPAPTAEASAAKTTSDKSAKAEKINLNTADEKTIAGAKGVGDKLAQELVKNRPYRTWEEVSKVKGVGSGKKLESLKKVLKLSEGVGAAAKEEPAAEKKETKGKSSKSSSKAEEAAASAAAGAAAGGAAASAGGGRGCGRKDGQGFGDGRVLFTL